MPKRKVSHFLPVKREVRDKAKQNLKWAALKPAREQAEDDDMRGQTPVYWEDGTPRKGKK